MNEQRDPEVNEYPIIETEVQPQVVERILKVKEAASLLSVSESLIYKLVNTNKLRAQRYNSSIRIYMSDLQEYKNSHLNM